MEKVFSNPSELEKSAKEKYGIPPFLMMENAAKALADFVFDFEPASILILCGKGNNGGDGYALARLLQDKCEVSLLSLEEPAAEEAKTQYEMCQKLGMQISKEWPDCRPSVIVDCLYGTGFHGQLSSETKALLDKANKAKAIRIACDIPSGLYFNADYTVTMGSQKLALYSDKAKDVCGKIIVADLGIAKEKFENPIAERSRSIEGLLETTTYLITPSDITLPYRKKRAAHKGTYGHTAVMCGEKSGAAILAASSAMNFGSGLTSLVRTLENSDLTQFKLSPSLMLSDSIPKKTSCLLAGSGFTGYSEETAKKIEYWFSSQKNPAAVFDAGFLTAAQFPELLKKLDRIENSRIILTPHLAEFSSLVKNLLGEEASVSLLAEDPDTKIKLGQKINELYPNTTVIIKSANTFIASSGKTYIITDGPQNLAKGGSGDILAGMTASLLAQGYSEKDAAITAAEHHALTARSLNSEAYNLTPEKLLSAI